YGGRGASTIAKTNYFPYPAATNVAAYTFSQFSVGINPLGVVFQALPGDTFNQPLFPGGLSAQDSGELAIFHELAHQLAPITGKLFDGGPQNVGINYWNTIRVGQACSF